MFECLIHFDGLYDRVFDNYYKYIVDIETKKETLCEMFYRDIKEDENIDLIGVGLVDGSGSAERLIECNIGYSLVTILNKYELISKCFLKYIDKIKSLNSLITDRYTYINLCYDLISELKTIIPIYYKLFANSISGSIHYLTNTFPRYVSELYDEIERVSTQTENLQRPLPPPPPFTDLDTLVSQGMWLENSETFKNECLKELDEILDMFKYIKNNIDNLFVSTSTNTKLYSGKPIYTPSSNVFYNKRKHPTPIKFEYDIQTFYDFASSAIYQIAHNNKVISKCRNCTEYFIPQKRCDEVYCDKIIEDSKTCKDIGAYKSFMYKQPTDKGKALSSEFYKTIHDRLKNNKKYQRYLDKFDINFQYIKYNKPFSSSEKREQALMKYLTDFDKNFQEKHPATKGKGYSSQRYWIDN